MEELNEEVVESKKGLTGRNEGKPTILIPGEIESVSKRGVTVAAGTVYDYKQNKFQQDINEELIGGVQQVNDYLNDNVKGTLSEHSGEIENINEALEENIPYVIVYDSQTINIPCDPYGDYTGNEDEIGTLVRLYRGNIVQEIAVDGINIIEPSNPIFNTYVNDEDEDKSAFIFVSNSNVSNISDNVEVTFSITDTNNNLYYGKVIFNKVKRGKSAFEEWKDANPSIENPTINRFIAELKNTNSINGPKYAPDTASATEDLTIYFIPNSDPTKFDIWLREDESNINQLAEGIPGDITNYAGIYDVSEDNKTGNTPKSYSNLSDAITDIVAKGVAKGGMSIKFIQSSDNKYEQWLLVANEFKDKEEYWERVVSENDYNKVVTLNDLEIKKEIDFSLFDKISGTVYDNGKLYTNNDSIYIPVEAGKTYVIKPVLSSSNTTNYLNFAILSSTIANITNGMDINNFANGYTSSVIAHRPVRVTMPNDAAYILVQVTSSSRTKDVTPRVFVVEDKNVDTNNKIALLNGVGFPFEFCTYTGYTNGPLRKNETNSPNTRILVEIPIDYIKGISLVDPVNYQYICIIHDGVLPTKKYFGINGSQYTNNPIDINSEIAKISGFTPKTLLVVIRKGDGTETLSNITDISMILNIITNITNISTSDNQNRTVKSFGVCPVNIGGSGIETSTLDFAIDFAHTPKYIKVIGGERYIIKTQKLMFNIIEYDINQNMLSYNASWTETEEDYAFTTSINAVYIRLSFKSIDDTIEIPTAINIEGIWNGNDEVFAKRPANGYSNFVFPVKTDTCKRPSANESNITEQYILTTDSAVIHLPSIYNESGKPTPLIIYIHGERDRYKGGQMPSVTASNGFAANNPYAPEWDAAGYAQMDVDLVPDCYNYERTGDSDLDFWTGGTSDDAACIEAAYEWVIEHYNIARDGVYLIGRSRGGQAVMQVLGHYNPNRLPVLCAISNAGANTLINYEVFAGTSTPEWELFCKSHGLPTPGTEGCPAYSGVPNQNQNTSGLLSVNSIAEYLRSTIDIWWNKAVTGLPMLVSHPDIPEYNNNGNDAFNVRLFDLFVESYKVASTNADRGKPFCDWLKQCVMRSPVPIRFDWCVGDLTQKDWSIESNSYAASEIYAFLNDHIGCKAEYRVWPTADSSGTQKNPHWHELMNFLDGDYKLANGVVIHNPSMARLEWLLWCQAHDRRVSGCVNPIEVE